MAVNLSPPARLESVSGIRLGIAQAAIKKAGRPDLLLIELARGTRVAGVFTQNAFAAAPVQLCRQRLFTGCEISGLLINSGNANAATGPGGLEAAMRTTAVAARLIGCPEESVLPFSTGVIGQPLPLERIIKAMPEAVSALDANGWLDAAHTIMTTDTVPKGVSRQVMTDRGRVTVTGIAKGVGMIQPDMATMLAFIGTDAALSDAAADCCLREAVAVSFNCVTVDSDTSTNDACVLMATGRTGGGLIETDDADYPRIAGALKDVCIELAQAIARDGEGATKFITVQVGGAVDSAEAKRVAYSIANSPLVKTAMFASDANWGRLAMAIGKAGVEDLDPRKVDLALDEVAVLKSGEPHPEYSEEAGSAVVRKSEFSVRVNLNRGAAHARVWTCDLSYDYVRINAEYRT